MWRWALVGCSAMARLRTGLLIRAEVWLSQCFHWPGWGLGGEAKRVVQLQGFVPVAAGSLLAGLGE